MDQELCELRRSTKQAAAARARSSAGEAGMPNKHGQRLVPEGKLGEEPLAPQWVTPH